MESRCPIPLYPQPPYSPCQTQGEPPSDESDFPPARIREDSVDHESTADNPPVGEHVDHESTADNPPVGEHVDLPSDESDFPPIREHASTPIHSPTHPLHLEPQSPPRCSRPLKKGQGLQPENVLNTTQQSKSSKRKRSESPQVTKGLSKRRRLIFDKTHMDWLKDELRDIKFEIGEVRSSMIEIAERLRNEDDFHLEHILFPI